MSVQNDPTILESWEKHDKPGTSERLFSTRQKSGINYQTSEGMKKADPKDVVQKFRAVEFGRSDQFSDELPELPLPGTGERRDTCGEGFKVPRACTDCGNVSYVGSTCNRSRCPRCWKNWDRRRTTTIGSKLEALRRYRESKRPGWSGWKFHHLVLSPPQGYKMNSENPLQRTIDLLKEVLGEIGVDTGYLFFHSYRGPDGDDRGFWKHVLPDGEEIEIEEPFGWDGEGRDELAMETLKDQHGIQFSPHFHAIVLSKFVETEHVVGYVEEKTGWTIHRITKGEDSNVSLYDEYDLARSVSYCLSHTGLGENRVAYRAFGEVANFTADESIQMSMDATVRSCAVNTLGLPYSSEACVRERNKTVTKKIERWEEKIDLAAGQGAGKVEKEKVVEEVEEEVHGPCNGRLIEVTAWPSLLNDREWMAEADHAQTVAREWMEWRERIDEPGVPRPDPWDTPE